MPYRNAREALEARCTTLKSDLARLRAQCEDIDALRQQITRTEESLSAAQSDLVRAARDERSPLDDVKIASPCKESWESMDGDERVRHCGRCDRDVFNIGSMTRTEAEALLAEHTGQLCVRLFRRADGTVLTADCPEGMASRRRRRVVLTVLGGGALAAAAAIGFGAYHVQGAPVQSATQHRDPKPQEFRGQVTVPEVPPVSTAQPPHFMGHVGRLVRPHNPGHSVAANRVDPVSDS